MQIFFNLNKLILLIYAIDKKHNKQNIESELLSKPIVSIQTHILNIFLLLFSQIDSNSHMIRTIFLYIPILQHIIGHLIPCNSDKYIYNKLLCCLNYFLSNIHHKAQEQNIIRYIKNGQDIKNSFLQNAQINQKVNKNQQGRVNKGNNSFYHLIILMHIDRIHTLIDKNLLFYYPQKQNYCKI